MTRDNWLLYIEWNRDEFTAQGLLKWVDMAADDDVGYCTGTDGVEK